MIRLPAASAISAFFHHIVLEASMYLIWLVDRFSILRTRGQSNKKWFRSLKYYEGRREFSCSVTGAIKWPTFLFYSALKTVVLTEFDVVISKDTSAVKKRALLRVLTEITQRKRRFTLVVCILLSGSQDDNSYLQLNTLIHYLCTSLALRFCKFTWISQMNELNKQEPQTLRFFL